MSKLMDLARAAKAKLENAHPDVLKYITALEDTVDSHKTWAYVTGAIVLAIVTVVIVHKITHG